MGFPKITLKGSGQLLYRAVLRTQRDHGRERNLETKEMGLATVIIACHRKG